MKTVKQMSRNGKKAAALALVGLVILLATKPFAQATMGLPMLSSAIYLLGFVASISCMVIGAYRALRDLGDSRTTFVGQDSIQAPNTNAPAASSPGRNAAFVLNACVIASNLASFYLSRSPQAGTLALSLMLVWPLLNIINTLMVRNSLSWISLASNALILLAYLLTSVAYLLSGLFSDVHAENLIDFGWGVLSVAAILASIRYSVLRLRSPTSP